MRAPPILCVEGSGAVRSGVSLWVARDEGPTCGSPSGSHATDGRLVVVDRMWTVGRPTIVRAHVGARVWAETSGKGASGLQVETMIVRVGSGQVECVLGLARIGNRRYAMWMLGGTAKRSVAHVPMGRQGSNSMIDAVCDAGKKSETSNTGSSGWMDAGNGGFLRCSEGGRECHGVPSAVTDSK